MSLPPPTLPRCYRHPDRETGRNCTRCGKPACSDCLVQATVGSHCLDCAKAARPDVRTRTRMATSGVHAPVTMVLIGLNLLVFLWMATEGGGALSGSGAITPRQADLGLSKAILQGYAAYGDEAIPAHQWYRLVTAGFIHFGLFHLLMNMLLLFQLGNLLERALGSLRFTLLYVASLLTGSLGVLVIDSGGLTGGASGAVFGLMAGAAIGLHRRGVNVFSTGIGTTLLLNLVLTFSISGISIGGHLGGAIGGAVCGYVMLAPTWRPQATSISVITPVVVGLVAIAASIALTLA